MGLGMGCERREMGCTVEHKYLQWFRFGIGVVIVVMVGRGHVCGELDVRVFRTGYYV